METGEKLDRHWRWGTVGKRVLCAGGRGRTFGPRESVLEGAGELGLVTRLRLTFEFDSFS